MSDEKLCLKWSDYQENVNSTFGSLRDDKEFSDMTLACEDGHQIKAHKIILAASSPFFHSLLKGNKHPHPMIFMRGVKSDILLAMVEFLYSGETNIVQQNLDSFLTIAEELKLKGLPGLTEGAAYEIEQRYKDQIAEQMKSNSFFERENFGLAKSNFGPKSEEGQSVVPTKTEQRIPIPNVLSGELKELDGNVKSMMEKPPNQAPDGRSHAKICTVCGKEGAGIAIRDHIEANHLEGIALPCNDCGKVFRSRAALRKHNCLNR